ncbi:MAG: 2Fe-2S iron-sulfur cluster-binding protein [Thermoanaerobaculales bacterium]|nr:2Fe-2S iron-sulfur cluster-binding protein [Thermoanaerobaculales bacterium]
MIGSSLLDPLGTPLLALLTTVHVAVLLLLLHRSDGSLRGWSLLIPSLALSASPWLLPTPAGVAAGLALHLGWFAACSRLTGTPPAAARPAQTRAAAAPAPAPAVAPRTGRPAPPSRFVQVPVIGVFPETDDITTFRMARPEGFDFAAGQFTSVRVNIDGKPVIRCYSISSAPEATGYFEISVKRQGLMSGTLHATVRPGSQLSVMPPSGGFAYPTGDDRPLALIAGGVGITPLVSMLRHAVHAEPTRPVTLLYSVHTHRDVAFRDELRLIARRHPQARVVITATRGPHDAGMLSGRIDRRMIEGHVADLANTVFMICGPGPMIEAMSATLAELGVPAGQIRSEAFEAAVASTAAQPSAADSAAPAAAFALRLVDRDTTVEVPDRTTLLDACEAAGIDLPSACRAGVCGTCKARLVDGSVRCDSELLSDDERAEGYILPCVSWPESDCAMEA